MLLLFEYPSANQPVPQYWTMVYAIGKYTIAVAISYIMIHELFPYFRLCCLMEVAQKSKRINDAIIFAAVATFRAIVMGTSIYVLSIW